MVLRFSTAVNALRTSQRALDITGNNVANANTPGYHRQVPLLSAAQPFQKAGLSFGLGVELTDINRLRDRVLEKSILRNTNDRGRIDARLSGARQTEIQLTAGGDISVGSLINDLFNDFEELTTLLDDEALRNVVVGHVGELTSEFNRLADGFRQIREDLNREISTTLSEVNAKAEQVADLNLNIQRLTNRGTAPNDLMDQRDQLITDLSELVNVQTIEQADGQTTVLVSGAALVVGNNAMDLQSRTNSNNEVEIFADSAEPNIAISAGELSGLLETRNNLVPGFHDRLDTMARQLIVSVDEVHAQGVGLDGPFESLVGRRTVDDVTEALTDAAAGVDLPVQAGSIFIGVTNTTTGIRSIEEIVVDGTESLDQLATDISGVNGVAATSLSQTGEFRIDAVNGFRFDFAGGIEGSTTLTDGVTPDTSEITATGTFDGANNDAFLFEVTQGGTVGTGTTQVSVTRASDTAVPPTAVAVLEVGDGYVAGTDLVIADGVSVSFSSGDLTLNRTGRIDTIADSDETGLLVALGLNTLFTGTDAISIGVSEDITGDSRRLALAKSDNDSDGRNADALAALRDSQVLSGNTLTFQSFYSEIVADIGLEVSTLTIDQETNDLLAERLSNEQQSVSGVDPNEELVNLIKFQRMFEMSARFINAVNESFDELMRVI